VFFYIYVPWAPKSLFAFLRFSEHAVAQISSPCAMHPATWSSFRKYVWDMMARFRATIAGSGGSCRTFGHAVSRLVFNDIDQRALDGGWYCAWPSWGPAARPGEARLGRGDQRATL
jgi:hypothetical protein